MSTSDDRVRVRFAPSPTGLLHVGGLRTALYNYLFARKHDGDFVLRIEDTDRSRYVDEAEDDIISALAWTDLEYDEGPDMGGDFAPYRQSERRDLYREYAEKLVEAGAAYYAFDTEEELAEMREQSDGPAAYDASTRLDMRNSLTMTSDEVERRIDDGNDYVVRLKVPHRDTIQFTDEVRGAVSFDASEVDDQVLLKSDGMPTYHLANIVDDHHMEISHVIRGEEWLSSTPKHVLMYEALGWEPPTFAHLPLILSPDSSRGGKLSKRDADRLGIPVYVNDYREAGYEPEGLVNFLALLGWNPGTEQELFTREEMIDAFSLERVGASGVQFDLDKLKWVNEHYVRDLSVDALAERVRPVVEAEGYEVSDERLRTICSLVRERVQVVPEVVTENRYFFEDPEEYEEAGVEKRWKDASADLLLKYADRLEALDEDDFDTDTVETELRDLADEEDVGAGAIIHPARLAVSGRSYGPGVFGLLAAVGKDACIRRMRAAVDRLG
jgi:glutamyl-tRNA synthetase